MIGQKLISELNHSISELEHLTRALPPDLLVDVGARVRAAVGALKDLSEDIDGRVKPTLHPDEPLVGVNFKAVLTVSMRSGLDVKRLKETLPERTWTPFVTSTEVRSLSYKPA